MRAVAITKTILIALAVLPVALHAATNPAYAQGNNVVQKAKIALVMSYQYDEFNRALNGFKKGMEKENISFEIINIDDVLKDEKGEELEKQLNRIDPDLMLTMGSPATFFVKPHVRGIPVVFSMVLAHNSNSSPDSNHNDNIAGVSLTIPVIRQFAVYKEYIPELRTIGVIYSTDENAILIREAQEAARRLGLNLIAADVSNEEDVPGVLSNLIKVVDAFWMIVDKAVNREESRAHIILECYTNNVPVLGLSEIYVKAGAAIAVCADYETIGVQSARIAAKILQGIPPSAIPVEYPESINVYINERIIDWMGLKIPEESLKKAKMIY